MFTKTKTPTKTQNSNSNQNSKSNPNSKPNLKMDSNQQINGTEEILQKTTTTREVDDFIAKLPAKSPAEETTHSLILKIITGTATLADSNEFERRQSSATKTHAFSVEGEKEHNLHSKFTRYTPVKYRHPIEAFKKNMEELEGDHRRFYIILNSFVKYVLKHITRVVSRIVIYRYIAELGDEHFWEHVFKLDVKAKRQFPIRKVKA